jgi:hypothetical protein
MFFSLYKLFVVVEEEDRMQELLRGLRNSATKSAVDDAIYGLLMLIIAALLILLLAVLVNMRQRASGRDSPKALFLSLCRAHRLKWRERWLLWRLARLGHIKDPARLFLEPHRFRSTRLPTALRGRAAELRTIRDRLFSELKGSGVLSDNGLAHRDRSVQDGGAALPALKIPPNLDVPPWTPAPVYPSVPPHDNLPDNMTA